MEEYTPNSHKYRESQQKEKKVEKVTTGVVKTKKKNELQKFADVFIAEDVANVKSYILMDVLVPAVKKTIFDIVTNGLKMLFGEGGSGGKTTAASRVSYRSYYDSANDKYDYRRRSNVNTGRYSHDYNNVLIPTVNEAEDVLNGMAELILQYGAASVADFYDLVGITEGRYTDNNYGWVDVRDIRSASIVKAGNFQDGVIIKFPKAVPLN